MQVCAMHDTKMVIDKSEAICAGGDTDIEQQDSRSKLLHISKVKINPKLYRSTSLESNDN